MPENGRPVQSKVRRPPPEPESIDLTILYEDDCLMAIDKPAGMVVHPTYRNWSGTLLNALLHHVRECAVEPSVEPSIVTRLDKDTSGIVIVALGPEIHARIQGDAVAGRVQKQYLAIVRGTPAPASGSIALPLARSAADRRLVVVDEGGQRCETRYELVSGPARRPLHPELALVRCELLTGRTHQIRVHLAARGWPIVGDRVYGEPHEGIGRQALHAWRVTLPHPISRAPLTIEAPLPEDLRSLIA